MRHIKTLIEKYIKPVGKIEYGHGLSKVTAIYGEMAAASLGIT